MFVSMGYIMGIPSVTLAEHVLRNNWLASNTLSSAVAASMATTDQTWNTLTEIVEVHPKLCRGYVVQSG
jgi:hypothetical protein